MLSTSRGLHLPGSAPGGGTQCRWRRRRPRAGRRRRRREEAIGNLDQDAGAITGVDIGAACTSVLEIAERADRLGDDLVALAAVHVAHEVESARIVLVPGVIEPLRWRQVAIGLVDVRIDIPPVGRARWPSGFGAGTPLAALPGVENYRFVGHGPTRLPITAGWRDASTRSVCRRRHLCDLDSSPTPYHAVETVRAHLEAAGFRPLPQTKVRSAGGSMPTAAASSRGWWPSITTRRVRSESSVLTPTARTSESSRSRTFRRSGSPNSAWRCTAVHSPIPGSIVISGLRAACGPFGRWRSGSAGSRRSAASPHSTVGDSPRR